jgi:hypothetical protein
MVNWPATLLARIDARPNSQLLTKDEAAAILPQLSTAAIITAVRKLIHVGDSPPRPAVELSFVFFDGEAEPPDPPG